MKKIYKVTILKSITQSATVNVFADSPEQADEQVYSNRDAFQFSGGEDFPDYKIAEVEEITKELKNG